MRIGLSKRQRRVLLAGTLLSCLPFSAAMAQDEPDSNDEVITVTGSRLVRTDLTAPSPITVVGEEDIKLAGNDKLRIEKELKDPKDRAQMVRDVLRSLGQPKVAEPA